MKIKTYINNIIAVVTLVALVSGFQISTENSDATSNNLTSVESILGVQEAYAGPCGSVEMPYYCDGQPLYCVYGILEIEGEEIPINCYGSPPEVE